MVAPLVLSSPSCCKSVVNSSVVGVFASSCLLRNSPQPHGVNLRTMVLCCDCGVVGLTQGGLFD